MTMMTKKKKNRSAAVAAAFLLSFGAIIVVAPAAAAIAQSVQVSPGGWTSVTGVPPVYNGRYVLQKSDFGFFWLDSESLTAGYVGVEAKCGVGQPAPRTGIYVLGDCNGITTISSSGSEVCASQFSGQCGAASQGCGGPRTDGTGAFRFALGGTWAYLGRAEAGCPAPPSPGQSSDLQGRKWRVETLSSLTYQWVVIGTGGTPPPVTSPPTETPALSPSPPASPSPVMTPCREGEWMRAGPSCAQCRGGKWELAPCPTDSPTPPLPQQSATGTPSPPPLTLTPTPTRTVPPTLTPTPAPAFLLDLYDERFRFEVTWKTLSGATGKGLASTLTHDSGAFSFFSPDNLELVVKVVDGRATNGHFWIFWAALTDVEWTLSVQDLARGIKRQYRGVQGAQRSGNDLGSF